LGSWDFAEDYVSKKVCTWVAEVSTLANIAATCPHAAYCAFTHGMIGRWTYIMRTIPVISHLFQPLEDAIHLKLIPSLTGHSACSELEREVLSQLCRLGGLGIVNPVRITDSQFNASIRITASLQSLILDQAVHAPLPDVHQVKAQVHQDHCSGSKTQASEIRSSLSAQLQRAMDLNSERGASSWLTALPLAELGFHLSKQEFWDGLHLRYDWKLNNTPSHCVCGAVFSPDHAMISKHGGLTFI